MPRTPAPLTAFDHAVLERLYKKEDAHHNYCDVTRGLVAKDLLLEYRWEKETEWGQTLGSDDSAKIRQALAHLVAHGFVHVVEHSYGAWQKRPERTYISNRRILAAAAEAALTPEERAARFIEQFEQDYLAKKQERGDSASRWPIVAGRWYDGLKPALDMGLVVESGKQGYGTNQPTYVPAKYFDAYSEALQREQNTEARAQARRDDLAVRLGKFCNGVDRANRLHVELSWERVEKLVELLEQSEAKVLH